MWLRDLRETKSVWKSLFILVAVYAIQFTGLEHSPFIHLKLPGILPVLLARSASMGASLLLIWLLAPHALKRFAIRIGSFGKIGLLMAFVGLMLPNLYFLHKEGADIASSIEVLIFSLFIGLDEEFFDRGLVFGFMERFGTEIALIFSSVGFGLAHLTNYFYGEDSFNYVLGHVVSAAAVGYFWCCMMLATGTIWVPVLIHGLTDVRWIAMEPERYASIVGGETNWFMTIAFLITSVAMGRVLLAHSQGRLPLPKSFKDSAKVLGLIE